MLIHSICRISEIMFEKTIPSAHLNASRLSPLASRLSSLVSRLSSLVYSSPNLVFTAARIFSGPSSGKMSTDPLAMSRM